MKSWFFLHIVLRSTPGSSTSLLSLLRTRILRGAQFSRLTNWKHGSDLTWIIGKRFKHKQKKEQFSWGSKTVELEHLLQNGIHCTQHKSSISAFAIVIESMATGANLNIRRAQLPILIHFQKLECLFCMLNVESDKATSRGERKDRTGQWFHNSEVRNCLRWLILLFADTDTSVFTKQDTFVDIFQHRSFA